MRASLVMFLLVLLAASVVMEGCQCGSSARDGASDGSGGNNELVWTVGGTVAGLDGTLILQNNMSDDMVIVHDGYFEFATPVADLSAYSVTVLAQPATQTCAVSSGTGTVSGAAIRSVVVTCSTNTYTVGGSVTGLFGSVTLQNNGHDDIVITSDGPFTFSTAVADTSPFDVTVLHQPATQVCSVSGGTGVLAGVAVNDVVVTCSANTYTVGGSVTGLSGSVTLQNNGHDDIVITSDGPFTFSTAVADTSPFDVTVLHQPATQVCSVSGGTGVLAGAAVTNVVVTCATNTYTVAGSISGLSGSVTLQNNGHDDIVITSDGPFAFSTAVADTSPFDVTVLHQPATQVCSVSGGTGVLAGAAVTNVVVTCSTNAYTVGGTVSGLSGSVTLQNNGHDDLVITSTDASSFSFATAIAEGGTYEVTFLTQPTNQLCQVTSGNSTGSIHGANVTDIGITCTSSFTVGGTITGLYGSGLVLTSGGGDSLNVTSSPFAFARHFLTGDSYSITVTTQPTNQRCTVVSGGAGTVGSNNVSNIAIRCTNTTITMFASDNPPNGNFAANGNGSARAGADAYCVAKATALNLTACPYVHALLSVNANDEVRDMPDNYYVPTDVPLRSQATQGLFANDWADMLDGTPAQSLLDAGVAGTRYWWSGSSSAGALWGIDCSGWTSSVGFPDAGLIGDGRSTGNPENWAGGSAARCDSSYSSLVCLCY